MLRVGDQVAHRLTGSPTPLVGVVASRTGTTVTVEWDDNPRLTETLYVWNLRGLTR